VTVKNISVTINTKWDSKEIKSAKAYLSRAVNMGVAIEALTDYIKELDEANTSLSSPDYSLGTRITSHITDGKSASAVILTLKEKLIGQYRELAEIYEQVESVIDMVGDSFLRTLLKYRYLDGMIWDEIGSLTGYSVRQIYRKHTEALKEVLPYVPLEWKKRTDVL
jgi:hypothetical protein